MDGCLSKLGSIHQKSGLKGFMGYTCLLNKQIYRFWACALRWLIVSAITSMVLKYISWQFDKHFFSLSVRLPEVLLRQQRWKHLSDMVYE